MVFPTVQFAVFFPIVLALSWALMRRQSIWKPSMLAASYVFYSAADPRFCLLLAGVTLANQAAAKLVHRSGDARGRKRIVAGISFIVFQAISYTVDVNRGLLAPAKTIDVALYLSFFPHLVAGPIVRAREFIPQLQAPRDPRKVAVGTGVALIVIGLIKKVAIADFLAREIVDPVFGVPQAYAAPDVILATYAYA
ncbi:MAG: MBOAT family protein, partial [Chthoniobacterales bacterium]